MAIIGFWENSEKETGQTISMLATATVMAIEHNYKVLAVSTGFKDTTIEEGFWEPIRTTEFNHRVTQSSVQSGVEGLMRIIQSNRGGIGIIPNYTRVVFRDRLDVLPSPSAKEATGYIQVAKQYPKLLDLARNDYNVTLIDIDKKLPADIQKQLLEKVDVIVISASQTLKSLERIEAFKQKSPLFQKNNLVILLGKYDKYSKFNMKNISRMFKQDAVCAIPYNTQFFEFTAEGKTADYFLRCKTISDKTDRNFLFMQEVKNTCSTILAKAQEVQMRR